MYLEHLHQDTRARCCKAYKNQRTFISRMCTSYLRDVTFNHLLFTHRNVEHFTGHVHLSDAQTRLRERLRQSFCFLCDDETCFVNVHMVRTVLVHLYYVTRVSFHIIYSHRLDSKMIIIITSIGFFLRNKNNFQLVREFKFPMVKIQQLLGSEFRSKFLLTYCEVVPRERVPKDLLETFPSSKEVFYRVIKPPSYTLASEPERVIPRRVIPADPEREIPAKILPERRIAAVHETLDAMHTRQVFAGSQI